MLDKVAVGGVSYTYSHKCICMVESRKEIEMEALVNIFRILSDETRLRIVVLLAQQEFCVCELSDILEVSQPKISKSLSKLRDMNLVVSKRKEKFVFYQLKSDNPVLNDAVKSILNHLDDYPQLIIDGHRNAENNRVILKSCQYPTRLS